VIVTPQEWVSCVGGFRWERYWKAVLGCQGSARRTALVVKVAHCPVEFEAEFASLLAAPALRVNANQDQRSPKGQRPMTSDPLRVGCRQGQYQEPHGMHSVEDSPQRNVLTNLSSASIWAE
jgi:hypothetical protein